MIEKRFEAVGMTRKDFEDVILYLRDHYSFDQHSDATESLAHFVKALAEASVKFNLTPEQVAVLAFDAGQFSAIMKLANGQHEDLDPEHLAMLTE